MNAIISSNTDKYFVLVTYDIVKTKRRTRVMKLLKGLGFHVQKSVFECFLDDDQLERLKLKLISEIDERCDGVRIYKMDRRAVARVEIVGVGEVAENNQLILI